MKSQYKQNRKNTVKTNSKKTRQLSEDEIIEKIMSQRIPKNLLRSSPIPTTMTRKLTFLFSGQVNDVANSWKVMDFRLNGVFSPDNVGTPGGFNEISAMYLLYVCTHVKWKFDVIGNEPAIGLGFGMICRDAQPSTIINTYLKAKNSLEISPSTGTFLTGQTTGQSVFRSNYYKIKPGEVLGNIFSYYGNFNYSSVVTSNPAQLLWLSFVLISLVNSPLTNGCLLSLTMEMTTRFYSTSVVEV